MVRIASFNVENLFARPKVFDTAGWQQNRPILDRRRRPRARRCAAVRVRDSGGLSGGAAEARGAIAELDVAPDTFDVED